MNVNGQNGDTLHWAGKLLSADDVQRQLNGHRHLVLSRRTIVTPLALDELRARGITFTRRDDAIPAPSAHTGTFGYATQRPEPIVQAAVAAIRQQGTPLHDLPACTGETCSWIHALARSIADGSCCAAAVFCDDPALASCLANKVPSLRAAAVDTGSQANRALKNLGANLLAVEMPGRTFFEVRQILKSLCSPGTCCPPELNQSLKELEANAHR